MSTGKGFTEEQKKLYERSGAKNDWKVGLFFLIVFLAIIGINILCRYGDNRKLEKLEYTKGIVTSRSTYDEWIGRRRLIEDSITVEYTPKGSDDKLYFRDPDGPYDFIYEGDTLRVYYEKNDPEDAFIAKKDWIIHEYVRADKFYEAAFIVSIFPLGIAIFFFIKELAVRRNIRKGRFKLRKSDGLYEDENLHELARMSNSKRSWNGAVIGLSFLYLFMMFMGIAWIAASVTSKDNDQPGLIVGGIFVIILAQGALAGIILTVRFVNAKKRKFIEGFMEDDATLVYKDREAAANVLWKYVKHFMESETLWSRYKYDYSKLWLEKYEDKIEMFRGSGPEKKTEVPLPSTRYIIRHPDMWSDIAVNEVPRYMRDLAKKYDMHFKLIFETEMAMFNDKCCLIFGVDNRDGIILRTTFREKDRRVEYSIGNFLALSYDSSDREGIKPATVISAKIRNQLTIIARGLDSKWSGLLRGDMSWFEKYKNSAWFYEDHFHIEERDQILDEIIAWQQAQKE